MGPSWDFSGGGEPGIGLGWARMSGVGPVLAPGFFRGGGCLE